MLRFRVNIGTKMQVGFAIVIALMLAMVYVGVDGLGDVVAAYEEEVMLINENRQLSAALETYIVEEARAVTEYVLTRDQEYHVVYEQARDGFDAIVVQLGVRIPTDQGQLLFGEIVRMKEEYEELIESVFSQRNLNPAQGIHIVANVLKEARDEMLAVLNDLVDYQTERMTNAQQLAISTRDRARLIMLIVAGVAVLTGIGIAFAMTRTIAGPVQRVAAAAGRLAEGDLRPYDLRVTSMDEVGDMAQAFERMIGNLREVMEQIQRTSGVVMEHGRQLLTVSREAADATGQIAAAVQQQSDGATTQVQRVQETLSAMEQLRQAIDQIASGANEQAQQVEATTRSLGEVVGSVNEVAASAGQAADAAARGTERAQAGGEAVLQVAHGIEEIRVSSSEVGQRIQELNDYSRQIGQIVDMISDIAEQTNLLALNAAIEAARAGEHGRGFGVVAEEVRQLAERSAGSTREIGVLIANIQTAVEAAVGAMQTGTEYVNSGSALAGNARDALDEIIAAISETDELARAIAGVAGRMEAMMPQMSTAMAEMASVTEENTAATQQMAAYSGQVVQSMDEVAAISEETAAGTEQVSASTEEVNAASDDMRQSVENLTTVAEDLERLVGRFRL